MNPVVLAYIYLGFAIISEVIGSTFIVKSQGFTKLAPSVAVLFFYCIAFYLLAQVVKVIPLGIAYAIWAGVGIILTAIIAVIIFKQNLDLAAMFGIALIICGVIVINLFSKTAGH